VNIRRDSDVPSGQQIDNDGEPGRIVSLGRYIKAHLKASKIFKSQC